MDDLLLEARDISLAFNGVPALRAASLQLRAGEVHGLIGQNGAGKSTLIKIVSGALQADSGELRVAGRAVRLINPIEAQASGIATIHQEISLVAMRSVAENILMGREPQRFGVWLDRKAMQHEARLLLQRLGLQLDVNRPLGSYDVATQQLVAIARALSGKARLVVMDEPTSSLDGTEVQALFAIIRQLQADGVSVMLISHRLDELYAMCSRITVMRDGRTVLADDTSKINRLQLVETMLGRSAETGRTAFTRAARPAQVAPLLTARHLRSGSRLTDVSLDVGRGEIVGLGGLLGSGRSETARALFAADRLKAGTMSVDGAAGWRTPRDAIAAGIGYCAEDRKLDGIVPDLSVRENLVLALLPRLARWGLVNKRAQDKLVDDFIARLGIKLASAEQPIRELSGGNQQKVLLARWLCMDPKLLILDEPTRGIDIGAKGEVQRLIDGLAAGGMGVLMVSSEIEELLEGCDRVQVLSDGCCVATLAGPSLNTASLMAAMAGGSDEACL